MSVWLVTDPRWSDDRIVEVARVAGEALGADFYVQLRERNAPPVALGERLREVTRATRSHLYVNRWIDLARAIDADGLHGAPFDKPFTMPAHDDAELAHAVAIGARAVLVSPIFDTPGKGAAKSVKWVQDARVSAPRSVDIIALGGVTEDNAACCLRAGANGVAVIRALLDAAHPGRVALRLAGNFPR